jgi:hypothetical protein
MYCPTSNLIKFERGLFWLLQKGKGRSVRGLYYYFRRRRLRKEKAFFADSAHDSPLSEGKIYLRRRSRTPPSSFPGGQASWAGREKKIENYVPTGFAAKRI